ncbi:methyltransferase type 11 [Daeguia caeni]|uniref:Methyltransferase type 11 n=1 Tax=Daeguia caeni TaxID=439612 RepID=A0ABV9H5D7_9HYPH
MSGISRIKGAIRYLRRGDLAGFWRRLKQYLKQGHAPVYGEKIRTGAGALWCIMTTPHTLFIARSIAKRLSHHGIDCDITTASPAEFNHDFYIVLCAQMFTQLPPGNRRIILQLEQSVSSRWFDDKYLTRLKQSVAVFDYSLRNIEFLHQKHISYPHVFYLPIGQGDSAPTATDKNAKQYDFLFYGDNRSSPRRQHMLAVLQAKYKVKIVDNLFDQDMSDLIRRARIVVNIHYYEGALLETPRIQECLSLGVPVLSESASDQDDYPELAGAVRYFTENSTDDLLLQAGQMLEELEQHERHVRRAVQKSQQRFSFMLDRALVALNLLPLDVMNTHAPYLAENSEIVALSLPETIIRRRQLLTGMPQDTVIFDGVRYQPGWLGCGLSFKLLARHALQQGKHRLTIMEDDAVLPDGFDNRYRIIRSYLDSRDEQWDMFSGVMAEIDPRARILSVEEFEGETFITLDRTMSMVFNIYNKRALEVLAAWNPHDGMSTGIRSTFICKIRMISEWLQRFPSLPDITRSWTPPYGAFTTAIIRK